jgi:pimeloyl-ACP methyl ester carboxylesterase
MPYVTSQGDKLHYETVDLVAPWQAARETIVFHHGIGADPGIWTDWMPHLLDRYRMVRFDMRGYGRSHIPARDFAWSLDLLARDLLAVADAAEAGRMHLVGESIGGTIALYFAINHPNRVATLTVSNGGHVGASLQRVQTWQQMIDTHGIEAWSDRFMRDRFFDGALSPAQYDWFARQQAQWPRDSILNALGVLIGTDLRARLPEVHCPVLLLHGDSSPFIPVDVMVDMHKCLPDSRLQVFAHARHGLPFSHAGACARVLREFLDERSARA